MPNSAAGSRWKARCASRAARARSASDSAVRRARVHDRGRSPLAARDVRRRLGREVLGVDRDLGAALLQEARAGQAHGAAAEDRESLLSRRPRFVDGELGRAPGERDAAAAVAVVVDDGLVADLLRPDDEPRRPVRTEADDRPDDAVLRHVDAREAARRLGPDEGAGAPARAGGRRPRPGRRGRPS